MPVMLKSSICVLTQNKELTVILQVNVSLTQVDIL